jgi:ribonuclease I
MPDITLSDGREITFDLRKLSVTEYRAMFDKASEFDADEAVMARCAGLAVEELRGLTLYDNKLLWREFFRVCREPLKDTQDPKA